MMARKRQSEKQKPAHMLSQIQSDAAGIDVGATEIYVAVPFDQRAPVVVRSFGTFTQDLHKTAKWLGVCRT
jgi:hypothetical protein